MVIRECNNNSLPKIILLHGMGMDGRSMTLVTEGMSGEYCLIIPDLSGQGSDTGTYRNCLEGARTLTDYLLEKGYAEVELLMGISLGAEVGMAMLSLEGVLYKTAVFEGFPAYENSKVIAPMMKRAFCLLRKKVISTPKEEMQKKASCMFGTPDDKAVGDTIAAFIDVFKKISEETISNVCDEVESYPFPPIRPEVQKRIFLEFGSRDMNCTQIKNIRLHYPYVNVKINKGYGHCEYIVKHHKEYGKHLEKYMASYPGGEPAVEGSCSGVA